MSFLYNKLTVPTVLLQLTMVMIDNSTYSTTSVDNGHDTVDNLNGKCIEAVEYSMQ